MYVLDCLSYSMIVMAFITFVTLLFEHVPYGRYASSRYGFPVNVKLSWFVQELPALMVPLSLVLWSPCAKIIHLPNQLLLLMFVLHYLQRYDLYLLYNIKKLCTVCIQVVILYTVYIYIYIYIYIQYIYIYMCVCVCV